MAEEKVMVHLRASGCQQILNNRKLKVALDKDLRQIGVMIRRQLNLRPEDSLFFYYKQFAVYPDTLIRDIIGHTPGVMEIDINYSMSPQFG